MELSHATKGNAHPGDKPRVYFTCHPDDLERYFKATCEELFKVNDCAVYYTPDMTSSMEDANDRVSLERMSLFVIPVTYRLLSEPNRALDVDLKFAQEHHIPVLPLMMESGLDGLYSLPDKFGELQYMMPYSQDLTEVSFIDKLKNYLDSVLISSELAERVRKAFDAYVFLSYRKKDRAHANELMRIIHADPETRDIAIWFDEFLTPGESFAENIEEALKKSELFTLLVTPNVLERPGGRPNFIMEEEYPAAKANDKDILAAMMVDTDQSALQMAFTDLPECIDANDESAFRERLSSALYRVATSANDDDPEHNYLIGLAYLNGIDVERDAERALELMTKAANAGWVEAIEKLVMMYVEGSGATLDWSEAARWAERLVERCTELYGAEDAHTLASWGILASILGDLGRYEEALAIHERVFKMRCESMGEMHPDSLRSLSNWAFALGKLGRFEEALPLYERAYGMLCQALGEDHPETLRSLSNIAVINSWLGRYGKALGANEQAYEGQRRILGDEHPDTLRSLNNTACAYNNLGLYEEALPLYERAYEGLSQALGEDHPDALVFLHNIAFTYSNLGRYEEALPLNERAYEAWCAALGNEHPNTLRSLNSLGGTLSNLGRYDEALSLYERAYEGLCQALGEDHPDALMALSNIASALEGLGRFEEALPVNERVYEGRRRVLGDDHPDTLVSLNNLGLTYYHSGRLEEALALMTRAYEALCRVLGDEHPLTLQIRDNVLSIERQLEN